MENLVSLPKDVEDILLKVSNAYQGIGDFEETGKNMSNIINEKMQLALYTCMTLDSNTQKL